VAGTEPAFFPVEGWLLTAEYRRALGPSIWLYQFLGLHASRRTARLHFSVTEAAKALGADRQTLYLWLDRLAHPPGELAPLIRVIRVRKQRYPIVQLTSPPEYWPVWKRIGGRK
jgi:hypothetical protein